MLEKVFSQLGEWVINPFTSHLHIGSQILLEDQFHEYHVFTIKDIGLNFLEENIEYKYTCQDSFSYTLIRQNSGYTIKNDSTSVDFIGSQTIDYLCDKIAKECKISYIYIPTYQQLIINGQCIKDVLEVPETFPFEISGSNAKSALIEAANQIGYQLKVYEYLNPETHSLQKYFWMEPSKNNKYTGLTYSPKHNIQNYSTSLKGDSLTTILNVDSHTLADEEITLLPSLTPFFSKYIASSN
jgi:hypothetical protein